MVVFFSQKMCGMWSNAASASIRHVTCHVIFNRRRLMHASMRVNLKQIYKRLSIPLRYEDQTVYSACQDVSM